MLLELPAQLATETATRAATRAACALHSMLICGAGVITCEALSRKPQQHWAEIGAQHAVRHIDTLR